MRRLATIALVAALVAGCRHDGAAQRPTWLSKPFEARLVDMAMDVKRSDPHARIDRALVVRTTHRKVEDLGGWRSAGADHDVVVLTVLGHMRLCHSAPRGVSPCTTTSSFDVVVNATNGITEDVMYGGFDSARLGHGYELRLPRT